MTSWPEINIYFLFLLQGLWRQGEGIVLAKQLVTLTTHKKKILTFFFFNITLFLTQACQSQRNLKQRLSVKRLLASVLLVTGMRM